MQKLKLVSYHWESGLRLCEILARSMNGQPGTEVGYEACIGVRIILLGKINNELISWINNTISILLLNDKITNQTKRMLGRICG